MNKMPAFYLISLFAVAALGSSALADPPGLLKEQVLISPPLWGFGMKCAALNRSDREIDIFFAVDTQAANVVPDWSQTVQPGGVGGYSDVTGGLIGLCIVEWFGRPGEVSATACAWDRHTDPLQSAGKGCIEFD